MSSFIPSIPLPSASGVVTTRAPARPRRSGCFSSPPSPRTMVRALSVPPSPPSPPPPPPPVIPGSSSSSSASPLPPFPPHIDTPDALQAVLTSTSSPPLAILKVYSRRCRSCKRIERGFARLAAKYAAHVTCVQLCSELNEQMARSLGVRGFPTFIFYRNGVRFDHFASSSADVLEDAIVDNL